MNCPACQSEAVKVIYFGLPMKLCSDPQCCCLFGALSWVATVLPIPSTNEYGEPGWGFLAYEGGYLRALWHWLSGPQS